MLSGDKHVIINDVEYQLAEDAEGKHYQLGYEPLRPQNAGPVQGDQGTFQLRPDMYQWALTDWSGGMGQLKFDPQNANRWWQIMGADVFLFPGELRRGYGMVALQNNAAATRNFDDLAVAFFANTDVDLRIYSTTNLFSYTLPSLVGAAAGTAVTGLDDATDICGLAFDGAFTFFTQSGNNTLYRATVAAPQTATVIETAAVLPVGATQLAELGAYVYVAKDGIVYEKLKTGSGTVTTLVDTDLVVLNEDLTTMDGRLYYLLLTARGVHIWEIVPTSAAGPGFGRELVSLPGFRSTNIHAYGGMLYEAGHHNAPNGGSGLLPIPILYVKPDGSSGTLGSTPADSFTGGLDTMNLEGKANTGSSAATTHYLAGWGENTEAASFDWGVQLFEVDGVTGGFAILGYSQLGSDNDSTPLIEVFPTDRLSAVIKELDGTTSRFWVVETNTGRTFRTADQAIVVSPFNNFGLADEKILSALSLDCTPLESGEEIRVDVRLGPDEAWENDVAVFTSASTSYYVPLSDVADPLLFTSLQIRMTITYGTNDDENVVIRGVHLFAQVAKYVRTWRLLVDIADNQEGVNRSGKSRMDHLVIARQQAVNSFVDGYQEILPTDGEPEAAVTMDDLLFDLDKPGEGVAQVTLREIG